MRHILGKCAVAALLMVPAVQLQAQSSTEFDTPAEEPPSSYVGRQYVDSRGCVYARAGIDGQTVWVPLVNAKRGVVCGRTPTLQSAPNTEATETSPTPKAEKNARLAANPVVKRKPTGIKAANPLPQPVKISDKPTPLVNLRPGRPVTPNTSKTILVAPRHVYEEQIKNNGLVVPEGYEPVWTDDRLNPRRQHQTLAGKAQMDAIWTKTVPRKSRLPETDR